MNVRADVGVGIYVGVGVVVGVGVCRCRCVGVCVDPNMRVVGLPELNNWGKMRNPLIGPIRKYGCGRGCGCRYRCGQVQV